MPVTPPSLRRTVRGPAALTALCAGIAAASLAGAPAQAAGPQQGRVPMHQCWVNGVEAPPGDTVNGTAKDDNIFCDSDLDNVTVWGGGGNDYIEVRGLVIDSAVMGGEGDDVIRTKHLVPQNSFSMVRGNRGNDVIKVATVVGDGAKGAVVHGDDGDDKITTGSVSGAPTKFNRGGGIVTGNDGADTIKVGVIDFSGRVLGGSENDIIEAKALGPESGGLIQAGPGADTISGPEGAVLIVGEHWGSVDGGVGKDDCKVKSVSTRTAISSCEILPPAAATDAAQKPAQPAAQPAAESAAQPAAQPEADLAAEPGAESPADLGAEPAADLAAQDPSS
ncbi:hypothetical protein [Streptomyces vilmorinianum]|uniref:hypothetical protein n=1 Tax=Streptomyces vilmorinianum TaxID=3051092 RepID=UPI0010FBB30E|nr:hypothetical protein [Streptomyces vilmorinianum]